MSKAKGFVDVRGSVEAWTVHLGKKRIAIKVVAELSPKMIVAMAQLGDEVVVRGIQGDIEALEEE